MSDTLDLFSSYDPPEAQESFEPVGSPSGIPTGVTARWCPICHHEVGVHESYELVPVCPLVYPDTLGLYVHEICLESERAQDIYVLRDRPRNLFIGRGSAQD